MAVEKKRRGLISVQLLRGIAALLVITYHISVKAEQKGLAQEHYFSIGSCGVDLFFIISGFIMCYTTNVNTTCKSFIESRLTRVFPPYWILTTIALIVFIIKPSLVNSSGGNTSILASYFLLPTGDKFLVQNGWTLSYEMVFYFFYALCLYFVPTRKNLATCFVLLILFASGYMFDSKENPFLSFIFNDLFLEFVLGILAFEIHKRYSFNFITSAFTLLLSVAMLVLFNGAFSGYRVIFFGIPMFLLFISVLNLEGYLHKQSKLSFLGDISYSLYLVHPFVLSPIAMILIVIGVQSNILFFAVLMSVSIMASYVFYQKIEYPITKKIKGLTKKYVMG